MKTKNKILFTLFITLFIIFIGYIILDRINKRNFHNIINIEKEIHKNTLRTIVKLHSENLAKIIGDYSSCEQILTFMNTRDTIMIKSDIPIIGSFDMDAVWVYDLQKICLYNEFTRDLPPVISIPDEVLKKLDTDSSIHYFLKIPKGILEISGGVINKSDDLTKVKFTLGYLLIGKIWDMEFLVNLSDQTNSQLAITPKQRIISNASDLDYFYFPLLSFNNKEISQLVSYKKNQFLNSTIEFHRRLYFFFGLMSVLILIIFYISFNKYVIRPLESIIDTLKSQNTAFLKKIITQTDEFGEIASIIIKFFKQKDQLEIEIIEKKEAEKEIHKLLHTIEQSPNTIVITDIFGIIEYVNPYFTELTGYSRDEVIGKNHRILKSGMMSENLYRDLWATISNGNTWKGEFINKKKNNEIYWEFATISPVKTNDDIIINYIAVKEDITERKKLEQKLLLINEEIIFQNEELKKLSLIARETSNAIVIFDNNGKPLWVNEAFTRLNGYTVEEFIIAKGDNLFLMESIRDITNTAIKVLTEKKTVIYTCQISTKYNTKLWIQTTLSPVFNSDGSISTIIAIDSDITNMKEAEEEIRKQSEEIESQRDELEIQRNIATKQLEEIAQINIEIRSSIRYAENIQKAILPPKKLLETLFNEHFVLYIPKDIVSGDFYWVRKLGRKTVLAIADCTGHGVPGAFMSMLGIAFLNDIVTKKDTYQASDILDELRELVVRSLHQIGHAGSSQDGMDMSLIILDEKDHIMQYAGANNPVYIFTNRQLSVGNRQSAIGYQQLTANSQLLELKPDKQPVAIYENMKPFKNNLIQVFRGDIIYMFTDGFHDQFGNTKAESGEKKFSVKKFKDMIKVNAFLSMQEQKNSILATFYEWRGNNVQTDDITVMGIKIE